jgi:hypothetical protein
MVLDSADGVTPSFFAAAVKLPSFTTKIKDARSGNKLNNLWLNIIVASDSLMVFHLKG